MFRATVFSVAVLTLLIIGASSDAATMRLVVPADIDNTIYEDTLTHLSNGLGDHFFAGNTAQLQARRALVRFDVLGALSVFGYTVTVDSVAVRMHMSRTLQVTGQSIRLHRVTREWSEGTSNALGQEGGGAPATAGDATWVHANFPGVFWTTHGGDYIGASSASAVVGNIGNYVWTSAMLLTDVISWIDLVEPNYGWVLIGNEVDIATSKRFDSVQNPVVDQRPFLELFITIPTGIDDPRSPAPLTLHDAVPNPFNPATTVSFTTLEAGRVTATIYSVAGASVAGVHDGTLPAGTHRFAWNGLGDNGAALPSGVYLFVVRAGSAQLSQKLTLLK